MEGDKIIGKGKFGKVLEVEDYRGEKFALKIITSSDLSLVEADILSRVKSPYIFRSIGNSILETDLGKGLTIELKENNLLNFPRDVSIGQKKRIIMSLLYGLECLHKSGFLHLDIKTANCLWDDKNSLYTAYLSDFGFSMRCQDCYRGIIRKKRIGTIKYFPYEFLTVSKNYNYKDKSDVWSLGLTILEFLGYRLEFNYFKDETLEARLYKVKKFWDETNIEELILNTLNNHKFSELDKIDLLELLKNMLKRSPELRISSKEFVKMRFFNNNTLENSCYVSKPKENLYIPYTSTFVIQGINSLKKYFNTESVRKLPVEVYFLSMEIFIRIMAITPLEVSRQFIESSIQKAFFGAMKYYKQIKLDIKDLKKYQKFSYDIVKYLNGDIAPNRYFYNAKYGEDLILVHRIVLENYYLISVYNYVDLENLFEYFRETYNYKKIPLEEIKTIEDLFDLEIPEKNSETDIDNRRDIFSYRDMKSDIKLPEEPNSEVATYRKVESQFREEMLDYLKSKSSTLNDKQKEEIKKTYFVKDAVKLYNDFFKNINVGEILMNKFPNLNYGIIKLSPFGELTFNNEARKKFMIFYVKNQVSLLVIDEKELKVTHYFSSFIEQLESYYSKKGYSYTNNYELKMIKFGKLEEITIIFIIYFNTIMPDEKYNSYFIEDKTLKSIITSGIVEKNSIL